ncbi:MAG: winged helix-turn-helix domain-containing protein [Acidobacteriota bacterium]|nr:winged helix-turn-helix domain-containing protein [Acidobacteriota bacterium]
MDTQNGHIYEFDSFRVDADKRLLLHGSKMVQLTPKAFEILLVLIENAGRVIGKDELLNAVWPDTVVEENNLSVNVSALRKALGESPHEHRYIVTVPGHGYRFVAGVKSVSENSTEPGVGDHAAPRPVVNGEQEPSDRKDEDDRTVRAKRQWLGRLAAVTVAASVLAAAVLFYYVRRGPALTDKDMILLADFVNTTGDPVFDDTLKQALAMQLEQSPFLSIFPEQQARETLRYMGRPPEERVTKDTAREICERRGIKALLVGSVSNLGSCYVVGLEATDARTGDVIAREQLEAESKEQVLRTLGKAAIGLREKLGESLSSIQKFDVPVEQATTSSLEAFKAFSLGVKHHSGGKYLEAVPFFQRAIELDPDLALAHVRLAIVYHNGEALALATESAGKAFRLRERVSERERLFISTYYYGMVTGESDKHIEMLELWGQTYPRDPLPPNMYAFACLITGQPEKGIEQARESIRRDPNRVMPYSNMAGLLISLNRFEEAEEVCGQALARNLESPGMRQRLYAIAFVQRDQAAMRQQVDWATGKPSEHEMLDVEAAAAAFLGQLRQSRELSRRAVEMAERRNLKEPAAMLAASEVVREAFFGDCRRARESMKKVWTLARETNSLDRFIRELAVCGGVGQVQSLADELTRQYPTDTILNGLCLPVTRALIELQRGDPAQAIQLLELEVARRYEGGTAAAFWPNYLRGQAYLRQRAGAEALAEFQKILDHRGWDPLSPFYPLAHIGLARAAALTGDTAKSRKAYEDFFALWKDADPDIPILQEAKREYEKLK